MFVIECGAINCGITGIITNCWAQKDVIKCEDFIWIDVNLIRVEHQDQYLKIKRWVGNKLKNLIIP